MKVAVLFGDLRKPDSVVPTLSFGAIEGCFIEELQGRLREMDGYRWTYLSDHDSLVRELQRLVGRVDLVLNFCDEGFANRNGRELHIPALLDILGLPYTGAGPQCLACCYDKALVCSAAREMEIPVPDGVLLSAGEAPFQPPFGFPAFVKPNLGDGSLGITVRSLVRDMASLRSTVAELRATVGAEQPLLIEEYLPGEDVYSAVIGNPPDATVLPLMSIDYSALPLGLPKIACFELKWVDDSPYAGTGFRPAHLPSHIEQLVVHWSREICRRLDCQDYTRIDWRLDAAGNPRLLEVNPNTHWIEGGALSYMAGLAGMSYCQLLEAIMRAALKRQGISVLRQPTLRLREETVVVESMVRGSG